MTPIERIRQKREAVALAQEAAANAPRVARFPRHNGGLAILLALLMPLVLKAVLNPSPENIMGYAGATLGFGFGLLSLSAGLKNAAIFDGQDVAPGVRIPLKLIGSGLLGLAAGGLTWFQGGSIAQAGLVLPVVAALSVVTFGVDPMKDKRPATEEERELVAAEQLAARMGQALGRLRQSADPFAIPELIPELRAYEAGMSALLEAIVLAPERARSVRKFTTVYPQAAADAAEAFAATYATTGDPGAKDRFVALIRDLAGAYHDQAHAYGEAGKDRLEVEMDVLDQYLAGERTQTAHRRARVQSGEAPRPRRAAVG